MDRVLDVVSRFYSVSRERVASLRRGPSLVRARQVAIYLCRRYTHHSLAEISDFFNRKSASTIGATARRVERLIESGDPIRREVREIREILDSA